MRPDAMMPLPLTTVADAVVQAVQDESVGGIYSPSGLQELALRPPVSPLKEEEGKVGVGRRKACLARPAIDERR